METAVLNVEFWRTSWCFVFLMIDVMFEALADMAGLHEHQALSRATSQARRHDHDVLA